MQYVYRRLPRCLWAVGVAFRWSLWSVKCVGLGRLFVSVSRSRKVRHSHLVAFPEGVISPSQRQLPANHAKTQQKNIHALGRIQTRHRSNQATPDIVLRPYSQRGSASDIFRMTKSKGGRREEHAEHIRKPKIAYMILGWYNWKGEMSWRHTRRNGLY
jgi:hypothetical protein